jgi:hypothetical protein
MISPGGFTRLFFSRTSFSGEIWLSVTTVMRASAGISVLVPLPGRLLGV